MVARLEVYQRRSPSTYGVEHTPCWGQSWIRPAASFSWVFCHKNVPSAFDSYRVDDSALLVRDYDGDGDLDIWLYYKGRNMDHGRRGPARTCMGLAIAETPESKHVRASGGRPILTGSHEVMIWPHREGVAAYASKTKTFEYAPDGIDFLSHRLAQKATPKPIAPGCYRPDLTEPVAYGPGIRWGISMKEPGGPYPHLIRYEVDLDAPSRAD